MSVHCIVAVSGSLWGHGQCLAASSFTLLFHLARSPFFLFFFALKVTGFPTMMNSRMGGMPRMLPQLAPCRQVGPTFALYPAVRRSAHARAASSLRTSADVNAGRRRLRRAMGCRRPIERRQVHAGEQEPDETQLEAA